MKKTFSLILLIFVFHLLLSYTLRPMDYFTITIYMSTGSFTKIGVKVDPDGKAGLPYVGRVKVEGLTLDQVEKIVEKAVSKYLSSAVVTISLDRSSPQFILFQGMVSGALDLTTIPKEQANLVGVLSLASSKIRPLSLENVQSVKIIRNSKIFEIDVSKFFETGNEIYNPKVLPGDIVYIPVPNTIAIFGSVTKPGVYQLEPGMTLLKILSIAGGSIDPQIIKEIDIYRNGKKMVLSPKNSEDLLQEMSNGDIVYVKNFEHITTYIIGERSDVVSLSERFNPTLREVLSKAGITFDASIKRCLYLIRDGRKILEKVVSLPKDLPDISVRDGDIIGLYRVQPVHIYVSLRELPQEGGLFSFSQLESPTLKNLLYNLGISDENLGIFVTTPEGKTFYYKSKEILDGSKTIELEDWSYVVVTPYPFGKVPVFGTSKAFVGLLDSKESLKGILLRNGLLKNLDQYEVIKVMSKGTVTEIDPQALVEGQTDCSVQPGDSIYLVPKAEKYLYITGDVSRVLVFSRQEKITRESILAKLGLREEQVEKLSGKFENREAIEVRIKKDIRIFAYGDAIKSGYTILAWDEEHTVANLLSKVGWVPQKGFKNLHIEVFRKGETVLATDVTLADLPKLVFALDDNDFVKISYPQIKVTVFGEGVKQGVYYLPAGSTTKELFAEVGANPETFEIILYRNGKVSKITTSLHGAGVPLKDNDLLLLKTHTESFVYVIGDVDHPGPLYVGEGSINALKALSLAGGLRNWEYKRSLKIIRSDGNEETHEIVFATLSKISLKGGDILYIQPRTFNRVYVLGAVVRPSVVYIDTKTSLFDAIMRAGGFGKRAVKDKVYVFRGGIKGTIEIYDMSWIDAGKVGKNPELNPGDIVYVPDNPIVSVLDMMSIISGMISFVNNSIDLYNRVNDLMGE